MKMYLRFFMLLTIAFLWNNSKALTQPSYCAANGTCSYEYIESVDFEGIETGTMDCKTYIDFTKDYLPDLDMGKTYTMKIGLGSWDYNDNVTVWIDFNQNGDFTDSGEEFTLKQDGASSSGDIKIPTGSGIKSGVTGMRIRLEWGQTPKPCGNSSSGYGNVLDFHVNIVEPLPDAHITAITNPTTPWRVGTHNVTATLRNSGDLALFNVDIDWYINDVYQGTHPWTGNLAINSTTSIALGNYNFDYPANGPWGAFQIKAVVRNANDLEKDGDPSNDTYTSSVTPILNDAGVIGFFGPPEGFGPGVTQVRARVRNYAPKPLTSVTINWSMDGVDQTPVTLTGINIPRDEVADLVLGTYDFYAKSPLGPFAVECATSNPNGIADEDDKNDKYVGGIGPSLAAGNYFIGATNSQFTSPAEAASYINSSGVFGPGKVTFEVRPGTYTGQIVLNSPLPNKNEIEFIGGSSFPENIVLAANTTAQNNFVILLEGLENVTFRNMTIRNNNNVSAGAGVIVSAKNAKGLNFTNVSFMGVANSPRYNTGFAIMDVSNCSPINVSHCNFMNGSVGIYNLVNSVNNPSIIIGNNDFANFSWFGVYNQITPNVVGSNVDISFNKFSYLSGTAPVGAIASWNSTTIANNEFSGISGTGAPNESVIYVNHTSQSLSNPAEILSNSIVGCTNINGIYVVGAHTLIDKNYVNISQTVNYGYALLKAENTSGAIGNNQLSGTNIYGMNLINSPELGIFYNSVVTESSFYPTIMSSSAGSIMRNIFMNIGTAPVLQVGMVENSNQNIFYSNGETLISDNGVNRDLPSWQEEGYDQDSRVEFIEFINSVDLHIKIYSPSLLFGPALFDYTDGYAHTIESSDFDGLNRISYYAGSHELTLSVSLITQSEGIVNCVNSTDNYISVTSAIGYDAPMNYQWYKDGVPVPGATEPILFFNDLQHHQAGLYHARIGGPGATPRIYSAPVTVYVLRPTEITRYSDDEFAENGGLATLWFEAHVNGTPIEDAIINDEVKVQWYYYIDGTNDRLLANDNKFAGVRSNYLTIRNFRGIDEGEYYAVIEGLCGTVQTKYMNMELEQLGIAFTQQPENATECVNSDVTLEAMATTQSTKNIIYRWSKDATPLTDNAKYSGTMTRSLTIKGIDADDAGTYSVTATLEGTTVSLKSAEAVVAALLGPTITEDLEDIEVEEGEQIMLQIVAVSNPNEVLNYILYLSGESIYSGTAISGEPIVWTKDNAQPEDAGFYMFMVTNNCGDVESEQIEVAVTSGTTDVTDVSSGGYILSAPTPNPVNGDAQVSYYVPVSAQVRVSLTDAIGSKAIELSNEYKAIGQYNLNINSSTLNLTSGTYFLILESNGKRLMQKVSVVK
ncbi:MAG: GEVED domain-containing protein [Candidatus Kapabacteria bacterium]|nr:GEVED domain-containing protein [Candidatus Kapabacteria bacterium]